MITIKDISPHYDYHGKGKQTIKSYTAFFSYVKSYPNGDDLRLDGSMNFKTESEQIDLNEVKNRIISKLK